MPDLVIRPVQPEEDAEALAAIYAHYVAHSVATFDFEAPSVMATREKFEVILGKGHPAIAGVIDGRLIGYAYVSDYRPRMGYRYTCEDSIYLAPEACGHGYGALMLGDVIGNARTFGFKQMLAVIAGSEAASIGLHKKFGFETKGTFSSLGHKFGRWIDVVHMQKAL
jgi:phosphinothricin acetyltransferase